VKTKWTPHPIWKIPSKQEAERLQRRKPKKDKECANALEELWKVREERILNEQTNAYEYGHELDHWQVADRMIEEEDVTTLYIFGGNRAGKSEYCAKRIVQYLMANDRAKVWCCHSSNDSSIQQQQSLIWKYIPPNLKNRKKTRVMNLSYTQKNGFSNNTFILPNGSQCWFKNYTQNVSVLEGAELDLCWCDELVPISWIQTLAYRLVTRNGKLIVSFTPVEGYTSTLKDAIAGVRVTEWKQAEMLNQARCHVPGGPRGCMPFAGQSAGGRRHVWFYTEGNAFGGYHRLKHVLKGKSEEDVKVRAYGWVSNPATGKFPRFGEAHIIKPKDIPKDGTIYMSCDPTGGDRNWFFLWAKVDDLNRIFVYREWPDYETYGEWAMPSDKPDGKPGPAQMTETGRSIAQYRKIIRELEKGENQPFERFIDPRGASNAKISLATGSTCILDQMSEDAENVEGLGREGMLFTPASGIHIEEGVQAINGKLFYDPSEPVSHLNEPKLYISEDCQNLIYALKEWTHKDGDKGACKDPVDTLRYLIIMEPTFIAAAPVADSRVGGY